MQDSGLKNDIPLLLPASRNTANERMMPKTSCEKIGVTFPRVGSGRWMVSLEPDAVMTCCSLVPENWPRTACVIAVGGWIVREYMNICEVVAMVGN